MSDLLHRDIASSDNLNTDRLEPMPTYTLLHSNGETYIINQGKEYTVTKLLNDAKEKCNEIETRSMAINTSKLSCYQIAKDKIAIQYGHLDIIEDPPPPLPEEPSDDDNNFDFEWTDYAIDHYSGYDTSNSTDLKSNHSLTKEIVLNYDTIKKYSPYAIILILIIYLIIKK